MPEGIIPKGRELLARFGPESSSIREESAKELAERRAEEEAVATTHGSTASGSGEEGAR